MKLPGPDHPITITPSASVVTVLFKGIEVAHTTRALALDESHYPTVFYIPREDARMDLMTSSEHQTYCPYKGAATYFTLGPEPGNGLNAVWSYQDPYPAMELIREHVAFYTDQVELVVAPLP